jgi:aminopeptidase N
MSSYLVAFLVSDFTFRSSYTDVRRAFRIWARDDLFEQTNYASETGPAVLDYYETYFGVTFPLPKQDMAAIPDFNAGAMENWGLVTYREADLLYETGVSSLKNRNRIAEIVSHELAHQWFGDLVTMEWWSDLWLNEGFASYVAYIGQDHVDPESAPQDRFVLENNQFAFSLDATVSSHPVVSEVVNPVDIGLIFDEISYQKGAAIIRMLEKLIGTETFNKGLKNYLVSNAYDNAVQDDLWEKLTDAAHEDETLSDELTVKAIMDTWTRQMGFPVITVKEGKGIDLVQNF